MYSRAKELGDHGRRGILGALGRSIDLATNQLLALCGYCFVLLLVLGVLVVVRRVRS